MPKVFSEEDINAFKIKLEEIPPFQGIIDSDKYFVTYKLGEDISESEHLERFKDYVLQLQD